MFVVGWSGNKSFDELVEADPDPTKKENTARKEASKREQRGKKSSHELARGGGKEKEHTEGTGWEWKDSEHLYLVTLFVTGRTREAAGVSRNQF